MNNITLPQQLARMDRDRMNRYSENLAFYNGEQWLRRSARVERHLTINYAKALVDKVSSYLMAGFTFAVDPVIPPSTPINRGDLRRTDSSPDPASDAERFLRTVYDANDLFALDFDTEVDCAVLGDAAYKVTWSPTEKRILVSAPDVQGLYAWWIPDNVTSVYRVAARYRLSADEVNILYGILPKGKSAWVVELWTSSTFELWIDSDQVHSGANPYGFIPYLIFPNLREPKKFWGISDIPVIIESQRELNRAVSQLSRILELSGNPIAVLENVEESSDIAVRPGSVWNIPEDARAYLLDLLQGGGVRLHIDFIELLFRIIHDVSESPKAAWGGSERDLSGVALEIEMQPLLQKVRRKRLIRAAVYRRRNEMILALAERFLGQSFGEVYHRIVWGPVLPRDFQRQVTNEVQLIQSGVHSRKTAMDGLGIDDPEREFADWLAERQRIMQQNKDLNAKTTRLESE